MTALATFKDLCIDANDAALLGAFWGAALGLELHHQDNGDTYLTGPTPGHTIWVNQVPEPKTVKHRMHLDLNVGSVDELERLGATVVDAESFRWTLMADPEGGELCAFVREPGKLPDYRLYEVVVDAADPVGIGTWWAERYDTEVHHDRDQGFSWIEPPSMPCELVFSHVPEPKTVKNRLHWDVQGDTDELINAGARLLRARDEEIDWDVLADPEGNEFCVFDPRGR
jgi:hypothetical protein